MHNIQVLTAIIAGSVVGKLYDPLAWLAMAVALGLGVSRHRSWTPLLLTVAATAVNIALVWSWWQETGIGWRNEAVLRISVAFLILSYAAYAAGRLLARLRAGEVQERLRG
jgi:hypothetical protein